MHGLVWFPQFGEGHVQRSGFYVMLLASAVPHIVMKCHGEL